MNLQEIKKNIRQFVVDAWNDDSLKGSQKRVAVVNKAVDWLEENDVEIVQLASPEAFDFAVPTLVDNKFADPAQAKAVEILVQEAYNIVDLTKTAYNIADDAIDTALEKVEDFFSGLFT